MPKAAKSAAQPKAAAPAKAKPAEAREDVSIEAALGSQVRHLRSQLGITASELAHEAGLSASALSKIENGQISPSLATLQALSRALHVPVSALFSQFEERRDCSYVAAGEGMRLERRGTRAFERARHGRAISHSSGAGFPGLHVVSPCGA
jgi:transcriptional regulator with XRE-family HTH domain